MHVRNSSGATALRQFSARLLRSRFLRGLSILSGGMVFGQALLIMSTPLLTRLYTPEEFGLFAIFGTFMSIGATMIALRYELAIPLERNERAAAALVAGAGLTSASISLLSCLLLWLWGAELATFLGVPDLAPLLWLLPPCLMFWGIGSGLSFWLVRKSSFRLNGINRIVHFGTQAGGQLAFGLAGASGSGLILGYAAGYLARLIHLLLALPQVEIRKFCRPSLAEIGRELRSYWRYPVFSASSAALQAACIMLPAVLVATLYGPAMAGFFALAQRAVALPLRLLGESASQVFLGEIRDRDHAGLIRLFKRVAALFAGLGLIVLLPLAWVGPWLFSFVFGEAWQEAGIIFQLLAPLYLTRLLVTPISQTLNVLDRQDLHLWFAVINALTLIMSFTAGWWLELGVHWTIGLFSVMSSMTFVFTIAVTWRVLRRGGWQTLHREDRRNEALTTIGTASNA